MSKLAIQHELAGTVDTVCPRVEAALQSVGFGVLSRIEFDQKIREKLGQNIPRTVILGACNPSLAYEAYLQTTDVALLVPCNVVVRELAPGRVLIEAMRPSEMLSLLPGMTADSRIGEAEAQLDSALKAL